MATEQIPTTLIADDAVTTAKVADDAVTGAKIENNPTVAGNLTVSGTSTLTGALSVDTISEKTSANGVSIDGLKVKDYSLMYGSNIGLTLDSNGYLSIPKSVWFRAVGGANQNSATIETISFPTAVQDSSNSYNGTNSTFTAPVGGYYYFAYRFMISGNENCRHAFYVNGSEIEEMYCEAETYANSSNFLTISLSANDTVLAKYNTDSYATEGNIHGGYRIFTGFKIG